MIVGIFVLYFVCYMIESGVWLFWVKKSHNSDKMSLRLVLFQDLPCTQTHYYSSKLLHVDYSGVNTLGGVSMFSPWSMGFLRALLLLTKTGFRVWWLHTVSYMDDSVSVCDNAIDWQSVHDIPCVCPKVTGIGPSNIPVLHRNDWKKYITAS